MDLEFFTHTFHYLDTYLILLVVIGIVVSIFSNLMSPSNAFLAGTIFLVISGIADIETVLGSMANMQIVTIFILIFITLAIRLNTNVDRLFRKWFRREDPPLLFSLKLSATVAFFSTFLNNTPIVAMLTGNVQQWARRKNVSPSKFLIPLSYAAILGGMVTVIGTSTNLVLFGLLSSNGEPLLQHTDFLVVGGIVCLTGILVLVPVGYFVLPKRQVPMSKFAENRGQYLHEIELEETNDLVGKSVQFAGLKNLQGIYLVEISRNGRVITPVPPETIIEQNDHFYFAGDTDLVLEYVDGKNGMKLPSEEKLQKIGEGDVVEVVIAANSKLSGIQVKDSNFRETYNASIIGIHRNGEKISGKIGYVKLKSGDLLLLLTGSDFENRIEQDKSLFLLSQVRKSRIMNKTKFHGSYKWLQLLVILGVITGFFSFFLGLFISAFLLVLFNFLPIDAIKREFNFDLLIVLACSLTLGKVFIDTGTAELLSSGFLSVVGNSHVHTVLVGLFVFTVVLTSLVTNIAAVAIAFPIAYALAHQMQLPGAPFYLAIAFAASAAFLTPMAYQTNMMVYGPGGYKNTDFLRAGFPLLLVYSVTSLITIIWWYNL